MIQHLMVRIHLSDGMHVSVLLFAQATPDLMRPDEEEQYCFLCYLLLQSTSGGVDDSKLWNSSSF
jgi:hypothetical protein